MEENKVKLFGETTRGTLCETFMTENQCPGLVEAKRIDDEPGLKGWWMSPALLGQANLGKTSCPRSSRIFLPGADLVPMVIFTEELNFDPTIRDSVKKHGGQVATNFFMAPSSAIGDYRPTQMILQALSINFAASKEEARQKAYKSAEFVTSSDLESDEEEEELEMREDTEAEVSEVEDSDQDCDLDTEPLGQDE
ncbi:hypothetical protein HDV63DRAFT_402370 [Trichoderma sp. SZMC 28014]